MLMATQTKTLPCAVTTAVEQGKDTSSVLKNRGAVTVLIFGTHVKLRLLTEAYAASGAMSCCQDPSTHRVISVPITKHGSEGRCGGSKYLEEEGPDRESQGERQAHPRERHQEGLAGVLDHGARVHLDAHQEEVQHQACRADVFKSGGQRLD